MAPSPQDRARGTGPAGATVAAAGARLGLDALDESRVLELRLLEADPPRLAGMAQGTAVRLTGDDLTIADVWDVAVGGADAELSDEAQAKMRAARALVERAAHRLDEHTYGINTGFGRFVSQRIPRELAELQLRLLRSHACGVGDPIRTRSSARPCCSAPTPSPRVTRARVETVELLLVTSLAAVLPIVPARGSVGASSVQAPLAHQRSRSSARGRLGWTASGSQGRTPWRR